MKALDVKIHLKSRVEKVLTENSLEGEEKIRGVLLETEPKFWRTESL